METLKLIVIAAVIFCPAMGFLVVLLFLRFTLKDNSTAPEEKEETILN